MVQTDTVAGLVEALEKAEGPVARAAACAALGRPGAGPEALYALERALGDLAWQVRSAAVRALGEARRPGEPGLEALLDRALSDESVWVRSAALAALSPEGDERPVVAERLVAALAGGPPEIAQRAAQAAQERAEQVVPHGSIWADRLVAALGELLVRGQGEASASAARALGALAARAGARAGALREAARSVERDEATRRAALGALSLVDPSSAETLACLREALEGRDPELGRVASSAASALGRPCPSLAQAARASLAVEDSTSLRASLARALGGVGDHEDVGALVGCVRDRSSLVRAAASSALASLSSRGVEVVAPLTALLGEESASTRAAAADALGVLAPSSPEARASLARLAIDDVSLAVRTTASELLAESASEREIERWADELRSKGRPHRRRRAALALRAVGLRASPVLPAVIASLRSPDSVVRRLSCEIVARLASPDAQPQARAGAASALPELLRRACEQQFEVSVAARRAIERLQAELPPELELGPLMASPPRPEESFRRSVCQQELPAEIDGALWGALEGHARWLAEKMGQAGSPSAGGEAGEREGACRAGHRAARLSSELFLRKARASSLPEAVEKAGASREYAWALGRACSLLRAASRP